MNEEMIKGLENVYSLIESMKNMDDADKNRKFQERMDEIVQFYYEFSSYCAVYQIEDIKDAEQTALSKKFFEIVKWIVGNRELFENTEYYDYIPDAIIDRYETDETNAVYKMNWNEASDLFENLENYLLRKSELEELIEGKSEKSASEKRYVKAHDNYMKLYYGHVLAFMERNFTEMPEEKIFNFISQVEDSAFLEQMFSVEDKKLRFEDENLVFQYFMFALKMRNKFRPQEILDDKIVQHLWNGNIRNKKVLNLLLGDKEKDFQERKKGVSIGNILDIQDIFSELLKREGHSGKHFFMDLIVHFTATGMPEESIYEVMKDIIPQCDPELSAQLLADIGIPKDSGDYVMNNKYQRVTLLTNHPFLIDLLTKNEKSILDGKSIDIPFDYAVKKLSGLTSQSVENIYTLMKTGYYKGYDVEKLEDLFIFYGLLSPEQLIDEEVVFEQDDSDAELIRKTRTAFYNRQIIPYGVALKLIKENYDEDLPLDEVAFKACISSVIEHSMAESGIDIGKRIFFGDNEKTNGFYVSGNAKAIWINNSLIREFVNTPILNSDNKEKDLEKKSNIWITVAHEMEHAKQFSNMEKGNIDFLTYNYVKEEVLRDRDSNFYSANYYKMFIEEDARQYGIMDAMKFLRGLGIKDFDTIFSVYQKGLGAEISEANIFEDSRKKLSFRGNKKINNTEYISMLIRNNPAVIEKYDGILKIEFNEDGSTKDVLTMLAEYSERKDEIENEEGAEYKTRNLYSIYYGIIKERAFAGAEFSKEEQTAIMEFSKMSDALISVDDLRYYAEKTKPELVDEVLKGFKADLDAIRLDVKKKQDKRVQLYSEKKNIGEVIAGEQTQNMQTEDKGDGEYGEY